MAESYKGNRLATSSNTSYNALDFLIKTTINSMVNTALPVRVEMVETSDDSSGYVTVVPLIQQYDGFGNVLDASHIHKIPYIRLQGGKAAIIIEPEVGDIGIAVFAQQDISKLSDKPSKPATFRSFSMADGIYLGGIMNKKPEVIIEMLQDGEIKIIAENKIIIESKEIEIQTDTLEVSGEVIAKGIKLSEHTHANVENGSGVTAKPQ